jgi:hypothetical protein
MPYLLHPQTLPIITGAGKIAGQTVCVKISPAGFSEFAVVFRLCLSLSHPFIPRVFFYESLLYALTMVSEKTAVCSAVRISVQPCFLVSSVF